MSIENPIGTIRKAVKEVATTLAEKKDVVKPNFDHYREALRGFKMMRAMMPDQIEGIIVMTAKAHDLKKRCGIEIYNVVDETLTRVLDLGIAKLSEEKALILNSDEPEDTKVEKMQVIVDRISQEMYDSVVGDQNIASILEQGGEVKDAILDYFKIIINQGKSSV